MAGTWRRAGVDPFAMSVAAFFDLDGTLLTVNSGGLWMKREREHGRLSRWQMTKALGYLLGYHFGTIDMEAAMEKALETVRGLEEDTVRRWTRDWFFERVVPYEAPGAHAVLRQHREQGDRLVLLTSSSPYESQAALEFFDLDDFLASRFEVVDGRMTGRLVSPVCAAEGKVYWAERYAAEHELDLDRCYFYSDSITDQAMLERVGEPRVVHPDPRLRRLARKKNWRVLDWS